MFLEQENDRDFASVIFHASSNFATRKYIQLLYGTFSYEIAALARDLISRRERERQRERERESLYVRAR